jgi:urease accessory protein
MSWHAKLALDYHFDGARTGVRFAHEGPLRVLQSLYPEGAAVCHNVLVHPPGGLVAGDCLQIDVALSAGAQALITTPGATRFYRAAIDSAVLAEQRVSLRVGAGAKLQWLPLESIAYPDCRAVNHLQFELDEGAQLMGWDCTALGLPAADAPFDAPSARSSYAQSIHWPGVWLERGCFDAHDAALLDGPLGLGGQRAFGTMWWAKADGFDSAGCERALDAARAALHPMAQAQPGLRAGATSPQAQCVIVRAAAPMIEPIMQAFNRVRAAWVAAGWGGSAEPPRIWSM